MLMFVLRPEETDEEDASDTERSYQYVMQAFERANIESVDFGLDEDV